MKKFIAGCLAASTLFFLLGASYGIFSPGGDLSGTWNDQDVVTVNGLARTDDNILLANGTIWELEAVPNCTDSGGNHLNYTAATNTLSCGTSSGGASASTGSFTTTWNDACTTSPTQVFQYAQVGNIVSLRATQAVSCTSDSTGFNADVASVPVAIRPTANVVLPGISVVDNGTPVTTFSCLLITSAGTMHVLQNINNGGQCSGSAFTASGTKGWQIAAGNGQLSTFTYILN